MKNLHVHKQQTVNRHGDGEIPFILKKKKKEKKNLATNITRM